MKYNIYTNGKILPKGDSVIILYQFLLSVWDESILFRIIRLICAQFQNVFARIKYSTFRAAPLIRFLLENYNNKHPSSSGRTAYLCIRTWVKELNMMAIKLKITFIKLVINVSITTKIYIKKNGFFQVLMSRKYHCLHCAYNAIDKR